MLILPPQRYERQRRWSSGELRSFQFSTGVNHVEDPLNVDTTVTTAPAPITIPFVLEPLGSPLPRDEHACSVSLPTWSSVVGYEEGNPAVTSQMSCGYPRFVYHPYILQLMDHVIENYGSKDQDCLILPTAEAAARCQTFLQQAVYGTGTTNNSNTSSSLTDNALVDATTRTNNIDHLQLTVADGIVIHAVLFPAETLAGTEAKAYWQHTGEIVSSRRAEIVLTRGLGVPLRKLVVTTPTTSSSSDSVVPPPLVYHAAQESCETVYTKLQERIAQLTKVPPSHVHLVPSGMAAIYQALRASRRLKLQEQRQQQNQAGNSKTSVNGGASIVFGFPYLDTLKLCSRKEFCPGGVEFFGRGNETDLEDLETLLQQQNQDYCALFTEVPSNPLLQTPDVHKLRELATKHDFALIVDDTIGNFANISMLGAPDDCHESGGSADAICTSLTKLFSGRGDAMAGSLVVNPNTETGAKLQADLERQKDSGGLFVADAWAVLRNSQDFLERNARINETAEQLADWLSNHKDVEKVYYPKYTDLYNRISTGRGYGGLLSILLEQHICQRTFYDALGISKGPSLGTNFSLMCPYTLLAHYHELDFAMTYNVQPNLLRITIGLEPRDVLQDRFEQAFEKSRLHPPLPKLGQQKRMYSTTRKLARFGQMIGSRLVR
ncbi:cystathionine gamma-synthase [Fragilaria crotonensis]|nr:cystathionine gamma-synthase [Fragilaria crotonensis]